MPALSKTDWIVLLRSLGYVLAAVALGGFCARFGMAWYAELAKPGFTPPDWLLAPVWLVLALLLSASLFLVWRQSGHTPGACMAKNVYLVMLGLNLGWSVCFFLLRSPGLALAELTVLVWMALQALERAAAVSRPALWLLAPYVAWLGFAWLLNLGLVRLN